MELRSSGKFVVLIARYALAPGFTSRRQIETLKYLLSGKNKGKIISLHGISKAWVVSLGAHAEEKLEKTRVRFIPFYELL